MTEMPLLSLTIFLPLLGALVILLIKEDENSVNNIKRVALWTSIGVFLLSLLIWLQFDNNNGSYQFEEKFRWFNDFNFSYHIGIDGISLFMVILSTFLTPLCILASWESIKKRVKEYMIAFLFLETVMIGMFASVDILLFYIFFEAVLIPMYLIIGIWGGERRIYASFKFFLYTLLGSVLMLIAIVVIYRLTDSISIETLQGTNELLKFVSKTSPHLRMRGSGGIFVKRPKVNQDLRFDMPVIGPKTVEMACKADLRGLIISPGSVMLLEREKCVKVAEANNFFILAVESAV